MYFSRWWFMLKVANALAQLQITPKRFERGLYRSVLDVGMLEELSPEETALLLFHQTPTSQWSDQALLRVAHWKRHSRLRDSAERRALQFRNGVPFDEVFPTAARYARRYSQLDDSTSVGQRL